jgi:hypothetical protein
MTNPSDQVGDVEKNDLKVRVEQTLGVLLGLPLQEAIGTASLMQFGFGTPRVIPDHHNGQRQVWDYALHVQCDWRIIGPDGIVTGSTDGYFPRGEDPYTESPNFDYHLPGSTRLAERLESFRDLFQSTPLVVERIQADSPGCLHITLGDGYTIEVLPNDSLKHEHWRFFVLGTPPEEPHFVVTGLGIED